MNVERFGERRHETFFDRLKIAWFTFKGIMDSRNQYAVIVSKPTEEPDVYSTRIISTMSSEEFAMRASNFHLFNVEIQQKGEENLNTVKQWLKNKD